MYHRYAEYEDNEFRAKSNALQAHLIHYYRTLDFL